MPPVDPNDILPGQLPPQQGPTTLAGPSALPPNISLSNKTNLPGQALSNQKAAAEMQADIDLKNAQAKEAQARAEQQTGVVWSPSTVDYFAHEIAGGATPASFGGFGMGSVGRINQKNMMDRIAEIQGAKGLTGTDAARQVAHFKAGQAALTGLEKQYTQVAQAETTANQNIKNYMDISKALPLQTGSPMANSVIQFGQKEIPFAPGHDAVAAMDAAHNTAFNEYNRVVNASPSGAGVLSDSSRGEAASIMAGNYAPSQKAAVQQLLTADMAARRQGLRSAIDNEYVNLTTTPGHNVPADTGQLPAQPDDATIAKNAQIIHDIYTNASIGATPGGTDKTSTESQAQPLPQGYQDEHAQFIADNKGKLTPEAYIAERRALDQKYGRGAGPGATDYDPDEVKKFVDQVNASGGVSTAIPATNVPLSNLDKARAEVATSLPGTAAVEAGNAASAGLEKLLAGPTANYAEGLNEDQDYSHRLAALTGDMAGSIAPLMGLSKGGAALVDKLGLGEKAAALLGGTQRAATAGDVGTNALYGGIRGFNEAPSGQGGADAALGAAGGAVGSVAGNMITKGVTQPFLRDETLAALKQMHGVDTTTLQSLGLGKMEEIGRDVIGAHGAAQNAVESFNRDNANRALANIGGKLPPNIEPGTAMTNEIDNQLSNFYNQIKPKINGSVDGTFLNDMGALRAQADTPAKQLMFNDIAAVFNPKNGNIDENGMFNGEGYLGISSRLRAVKDALTTKYENSGDLQALDMAKVADDALGKFKDLVGRKIDASTFGDLKNVEKGWAVKMRIDDATRRALPSNMGVYSPSQYGQAIKKLDTSVNQGAVARGEGLDQPYQLAAQRILGSGSVPEKPSLRNSLIGVGALLGANSGPAAHALGLHGTGDALQSIAPILNTAVIGSYAPGVKRIGKFLVSQRPDLGMGEDPARMAIADAFRKAITGD